MTDVCGLRVREVSCEVCHDDDRKALQQLLRPRLPYETEKAVNEATVFSGIYGWTTVVIF